MINRARFAPSPSGSLHVGNARSAVLNFIYINKLGGEFILRIDDTDKDRSKKIYEDKIKNDLKWLGLVWSKTFNQSERQKIYDVKILDLKKQKRIYPCFETPEELILKKKSQLTSGKPPIYDRSALNLSDENIKKLIEQGKKPHWRFKLENKKIQWKDIIKGKVTFDAKNLSDPVLIREDNTLLYHLPSVIDDIEEEITDIIRGEDHITNTAFHIQLFEALNSSIPNFGHHPFLTDNEGKGFSKRLGSLSIEKMREEGIENLTLLNYLSSIGTSFNLSKETNIEKIIDKFDISNLSTSSAKFSIEDVRSLNRDIIQNYEFSEIKNRFNDLNIRNIDNKFWDFVKNNIDIFSDSLEWLKIVESDEFYKDNDIEFLNLAASLLPIDPFTLNTWDEWISKIKDKTGRKGRDLFMPLRWALTGKNKGPELKFLLPLLSRKHLLKKLGINV